jgi:hypothetical protein
MRQHAIKDLDGDKGEIQRRRDRKSSPECVDRMSMAMAVTMVVAMTMAVTMAVPMIVIMFGMRRHAPVKAFLPLTENIHT